MTPIGAVLTVAFCIAILVVPRKHAALAFVAATLYITQGQAVDLAGVNFMAIRFIAVCALLRLLMRGELKSVVFGKIDRWLIICLAAYPILMTARTGKLDPYSYAVTIDAWIAYFTFRAFLTDETEFRHFVRGFAILLVPFALFMTVESIRGVNMFAAMGGVPETPVLREGHYRCQGSFRVAITAGSLGATSVPWFVAFALLKPRKIWPILGVISCIAIVLASHSSGPLMAACTALVGWMCWPMRRNMKWVRRGIVLVLVCLHLAMSKPVWFIFDRISGLIGGDGWHRSNLIDQFFRHWNEWLIAGMPIEATGSWAATQMPWGGIDVTNYYVSLGLGGGIIPLVAFIVMLVAVFRQVGRSLETARENFSAAGDRTTELLLWGAGVTVCAHAVNLTAVQYWDQFYVIWYLHLAVAASLSGLVLSTSTADATQAAYAETADFTPLCTTNT